MIEIRTARSGAKTLQVNGIALHSSYDPVREADRFVEDALAQGNPSTVIVLGEGLGYAFEALRARLPASKIISVHYSTEVFRQRISAGGLAWHPGSPQALPDFLRAHLGELDLEGLQVIEWPPSAALFSSVSRMAGESVRQAVTELNGSLTTAVAFGRRWLRNCVMNFLAFDRVLSGDLCHPERTILIAASGPSLETAMPLIAEHRGGLDLWALPSSALPLREGGLLPDLLVMTDPGFYSPCHLDFAASVCPVAMPLSAARGLWRNHASPFVIAQPGFVEQALLAKVDMRPPRVPPHGTVAATAIDLALSSTSGPVVCAGLDMCARGLLSHARPNALERLLWLSADRLSPLYSSAYMRAKTLSTEPVQTPRGTVMIPRALRTYAGWFSQQPDERLYRLLPSPVDLPRLRGLDPDSFHRMMPPAGRTSEAGPRLASDPRYPRHAERLRIVVDLLEDWTRMFEEARVRAQGPEGIAAIAGSDAFSLAYEIEPRLLLDARKKIRLGDAAGARAAVVSLCETCAELLRSMRARVHEHDSRDL